MNFEDACRLIEEVLHRKLINAERAVLQGIWQKQTYEQTAKEHGFSQSYLEKDIAPKLFALLTDEFGSAVKKRNIREVVEQYAAQREQRSLRRQDWGEAIDLSHFYGRDLELGHLRQWIVTDRCQLITLWGLAGIGKTTLAYQLAQQVQDEFELIFRRSLSLTEPQSLTSFLLELLAFLPRSADSQASAIVTPPISPVLKCLQQHRCLIVLDGIEALFQPQQLVGQYRQNCAEYEEFFRQVSVSLHQSCLLLTTREHSKELILLGGRRTRSYAVAGLTQEDGRQIFSQFGVFQGTEQDWQTLTNYYGGNPALLRRVAVSLNTNITGFLNYLHQGDLRDIYQFWQTQFDRLAPSEQEILYWLALAQKPLSVEELRNDLWSQESKYNLTTNTLESLQRRSLIIEESGLFSLLPTLKAYVLTVFLSRVIAELESEPLSLFMHHALIKAQVDDDIREQQVRFVLEPIARHLRETYPTKVQLIQKLQSLVDRIRAQHPQRSGYGGGNIINLYCHLGLNLEHTDFSNLALWQAYLQNVSLRNANFAHTDLAQSVFTKTLGSSLIVAIGQQDRLLATADERGEVLIWSVATGEQQLTCQGHTQPVKWLEFSPDGSMLASGSDDQSIRLWDTTSGQCLQTLLGWSDCLQCFAFHPDGTLLATGSDQGVIRLWNVKTGRPAQTFQGRPVQIQHNADRICGLAFNAEGTVLASSHAAVDQQRVCLWNVTIAENWATVDRQPYHSMAVGGEVRAVAFLPDGRAIAVATEDNLIFVWDITTAQSLPPLEGHADSINAIVVGKSFLESDASDRPSTLILASSSYDNTIKVWQVNVDHSDQSQCLWTLQTAAEEPLEGSIRSLALGTKGQILATGGMNPVVKLWHWQANRRFKTLTGYRCRVCAFALHPDDRVLAVGNGDHTIRLWNARTDRYLTTLAGHRDWVCSVTFSPDGSLLASGSNDHTIRLWQWETGACLTLLEGHQKSINAIAFSPDGSWLASGSADQTIKLWDLTTETCQDTFRFHQGSVDAIAFSPDGKILASGSGDQTIRLWDLLTGDCLLTLQDHHSRINCLAFSPDGRVLASGSGDQTVRLWDIETGECLQVLRLQPHQAQALEFDETTLWVTVGHDRTLKLHRFHFDQTLPDQITILLEQVGSGWQTAFSPSKRTLISVSRSEETIQLWDIKNARCRNTMRVDRPYGGLNITGVEGITPMQRETLERLRAIGA